MAQAGSNPTAPKLTPAQSVTTEKKTKADDEISRGCRPETL